MTEMQAAELINILGATYWMLLFIGVGMLLVGVRVSELMSAWTTRRPR